MVGTESVIGGVVVDHEHGAGGIDPVGKAAQPASTRGVQSDQHLRLGGYLIWRHDETGYVQPTQRLRGLGGLAEAHPHRRAAPMQRES